MDKDFNLSALQLGDRSHAVFDTLPPVPLFCLLCQNTVLLGLASFVLVMLSGRFILHFDITGEQMVLSLKQICGMTFFNYLAIAPIIALSVSKRGYYLVGAGVSFLLGLANLFVGKSALTNVFLITTGYTLVDYATDLETASPLEVGRGVRGTDTDPSGLHLLLAVV